MRSFLLFSSDYGFFLTSADDDNSGVWLNSDKTLEYYMLRDGDSVHYMNKIRNIRLRMLDGKYQGHAPEYFFIIRHFIKTD